MDLLHYSYTEVTEIRPMEQDGRKPGKPNGFWVTTDTDDGWESWCRGEEWGLSSLENRHKVLLDPSARLIKLDTYSDVRGFGSRYGVEEKWHGISKIDWQALAEEYDGILIFPYQWDARLNDDCDWYYGWDCASGCIWNPEAITSVTLLN